MCSLISSPEIWAALIGALIGAAATFFGVRLQAHITDQVLAFLRNLAPSAG
jgi:hypothetical protein